MIVRQVRMGGAEAARTTNAGTRCRDNDFRESR
jgi:hypothetical protein